MDHDMDRAKAASLMGQKKMGQVNRHQAVLNANGVVGKEGLKQALSGVDNMSTVDKYHASKGKEGSIVNKVLGGRFGPQ